MLTVCMAIVAAALAKDELDLSGKPIDQLGEGFESRNFGFSPPYSPNLHWALAGFAMVTPQRVILTRDLPSLHGVLWNKNPVLMRNWMVQINFRIHSEKTTHADGIAFWYTEKTGTGTAYGAPQNFSGIGVALDTYSNQNKNRERITVLFNRGDREFKPEDDGASLPFDNEKNTGQIVCDVPKNKMFVVTKNALSESAKILIRYYHETLTIYFAGHDDTFWTRCGSYDGLQLPVGYYFGVSAATGELYSSHEILTIKVLDLLGNNDKKPSAIPSALGDMIHLDAKADSKGCQEIVGG